MHLSMRPWNQLAAACFLLCLGTICGAESKALRDLAPTVAELGKGWKEGRISCLIDALSHPSEIVETGHPDPEHLLKTLHEMMERTGREAYSRIHFGHSAWANHDCIVYIQRWPNEKSLSSHEYRKDPVPGKTAPRVGQEAYWTGGPSLSGLTYRLNQYLIVIEGWASDDKEILRLATVIEAKIAGKPIPRDGVAESGPTNAEPGTSPNSAPPNR